MVHIVSYTVLYNYPMSLPLTLNPVQLFIKSTFYKSPAGLWGIYYTILCRCELQKEQ